MRLDMQYHLQSHVRMLPKQSMRTQIWHVLTLNGCLLVCRCRLHTSGGSSNKHPDCSKVGLKIMMTAAECVAACKKATLRHDAALAMILCTHGHVEGMQELWVALQKMTIAGIAMAPFCQGSLAYKLQPGPVAATVEHFPWEMVFVHSCVLMWAALVSVHIVRSGMSHRKNV